MYGKLDTIRFTTGNSIYLFTYSPREDTGTLVALAGTYAGQAFRLPTEDVLAQCWPGRKLEIEWPDARAALDAHESTRGKPARLMFKSSTITGTDRPFENSRMFVRAVVAHVAAI